MVRYGTAYRVIICTQYCYRINMYYVTVIVNAVSYFPCRIYGTQNVSKENMACTFMNLELWFETGDMWVHCVEEAPFGWGGGMPLPHGN